MKDTSILINAGADINKSLELLGDMDMYNEVLKDFLDVVNEKVTNLNKYKSTNDMNNYAIDVHALKSDVRYLGFMALGDMAYELEMLSKNNDIMGVAEKHPALINEVKKVVSACYQYTYGKESEQMNEENEITDIIKDLSTLDPMSQALMYQGNNVKSEQNTSGVKDGIILIVDDSTMVSNFIKKVFVNKYEVVLCQDGSYAIEFCKDPEKRSRIKACLLDLNMPNVDGFAVLENFKENNYFVKMPVVVISGVENLDAIAKAKSYPIVEVLAKPFNERDLEMALNRCLATYF